MQRFQLLSQVAAPGTGAAVTMPAAEHPDFLRGYSACMTGGTSAVVRIEVSNDNKCWVILAIMTLTPGVAEGTSSAVPWGFVRGNVLSVSGGGTIDASVTIGIQGVR